ncbi:MAG: adenine phosphoribosyltransferase [Tissierellia bacterium]|nr:adenine phosphoribosyltransferase [Tissierellia bacterium]
MNLFEKIREIDNYPVEGVSFKDITTILKEPNAFKEAIDQMINRVKDLDFNVILAAEARGFVVGAPLAYALNKSLVPVRKPGKLPASTLRRDYELEYGSDSLEIHLDAINPGDKVLIVDDLLATGGTSSIIKDMVIEMGAEVAGYLFLIELEFLNGREKLGDYPVDSILVYKE